MAESTGELASQESATLPARANEARQRKVVVVGAGVAGLAAASELLGRGKGRSADNVQAEVVVLDFVERTTDPAAPKVREFEQRPTV